MTEDFRKSLDDKEHCVAIMIDLLKAFDSICHSLLISKLKAYGFSDEAAQLMKSYLTGRTQRVRVGNFFSEWKAVKHGVPQGSILGPLLFNIFLNDLNYFINDVSLRLYADDTTEYSSHHQHDTLQFIVQDNLDALVSWFKNNYLFVNDLKSKALLLGVIYHLTTELNGSPIDVVDNMKLLGLTIDGSLSFKTHVKSACSKVNAKVASLRRIRRFIPTEVMIKIYKAFILPHLEYCSPVLVGLSPGISQKLEITNQYAIRTLLNMPKTAPYEDLLRLVDLKSLEQRRYFQSLVLFYKCLHNMGPTYIRQLFSLRSNERNLRGFCKLNQPAYKTRFGHRSFTYITTRLWNNLPDHIRRLPTLSAFKANLLKLKLLTGVSCPCPHCGD